LQYKWDIEKENRCWQVGKLKKGEKLDFWPFGNFESIPENGDLAKTDVFELKLWVVKKGEKSKHTPKVQRKAREYILVIKGRTKGKVKKPKGVFKEITLSGGDYIIIEPAIISNPVEEVLTEQVMVITVRTPSNPEDGINIRDFEGFKRRLKS
jgi:hypothetical protein